MTFSFEFENEEEFLLQERRWKIGLSAKNPNKTCKIDP
jgi:hypothetical protein